MFCPDRFYVVHNGKMVMEGGVGPFGYKAEDVEAWLKKHQGEQKKN